MTRGGSEAKPYAMRTAWILAVLHTASSQLCLAGLVGKDEIAPAPVWVPVTLLVERSEAGEPGARGKEEPEW